MQMLAPIAGSQNRNSTIDAIKGFAISLVVLGHVLQSHLPSPTEDCLYRIIYSFHMPLFMLVSGWNARPETTGRTAKTLKRLLPATFAWYTIQYFAEGTYKAVSFGTYLLGFLRRPDAGLWFLWTLAFCIAAIVLCWRLEAKIGFIAYAAAAAVLFLLPAPYLGIPLIKYYFPFVMTGYLLSRYSTRLKPARPYFTAAAATVYPLLLPLWHMTYMPGSGARSYLFAGHRLPVEAIEYVTVKYIEGFAGSLIACCVVWLLCRRLHVSLLVWLGRHTLEIYVSHQFFVCLFPSTLPVAILAVSIVSLLAAVGLAIVLKRVPGCDFLLYGGPLRLRTNASWA